MAARSCDRGFRVQDAPACDRNIADMTLRGRPKFWKCSICIGNLRVWPAGFVAEQHLKLDMRNHTASPESNLEATQLDLIIMTIKGKLPTCSCHVQIDSVFPECEVGFAEPSKGPDDRTPVQDRRRGTDLKGGHFFHVTCKADNRLRASESLLSRSNLHRFVTIINHQSQSTPRMTAIAVEDRSLRFKRSRPDTRRTQNDWSTRRL